MIDTARRFLDQAGDRVVLFDAGHPAVDGVDTMLLPGHTGGQVGFLFDGGEARLLYTADAAGHPPLAAAAGVALRLRRRLAARHRHAAKPGLFNFTPHFPWPS